MARRSRRKSSGNPLPLIIGAVVLVALIAAGYFFIQNKGSDSDRDFDPSQFPMETYVNNGNSLRGSNNYYSLTGEVFSKPYYDPTKGQKVFIHVAVDPATYPTGLPTDLGVFVPADIKGPNIETKQSYTFIVQASQEGNLTAVEYEAK